MRVVNWCIQQTLAEVKLINEKRRILPRFGADVYRATASTAPAFVTAGFGPPPATSNALVRRRSTNVNFDPQTESVV
jgi:hypothetical protein